MNQLNFMLPTFILLYLFLAAPITILLFRCLHRKGFTKGLKDLPAKVLILARSSGKGTRRGLSIQVTDHAVVHRVLVQQCSPFQEHPANVTPSTILSRNRHCNIFSAPYGPFWRAARRNMVTGVLHPSRLGMFEGTRACVLRDLVDTLKSGAPVGESLHFPVYQIAAEMCFGKEMIAMLGETDIRAMQKLQHEMLLALPSFAPMLIYPTIGKLLYPSRWGKLLSFRRQQEEAFLPLVAEIRSRKESDNNRTLFTSYVGSLLDLRFHEQGEDVQVTEGQLVSFISEFLGTASDSTGAALEWTMANLIKSPEIQKKLRTEINSVACSGVFVEETSLSRMPYLRAVVLETLRRHPTIPFVMRHAEGDDAAKLLGMSRLPHGGTTVNFLVGKISRNPKVWSDPMSFLPERFMPGGEGECVDLTGTREVKMMPFGAGRRMCPGMALAMFHVGYFVANLVREFEWLEAEGEEAVNLDEYHGFPFTTMKHPLRARLVPLT